MTDVVTFSVLGTPIPQGSTKAFARIGRDGKAHATTTGANAKTKGWRQDVAACALGHAPSTPWTGPVAVEIAFRLPRPASVSAKKRPSHTVKPDLDKLVRAVSDALTGVLWVDDSQIVSVIATKLYAAGADHPPGATITASLLP